MWMCVLRQVIVLMMRKPNTNNNYYFIELIDMWRFNRWIWSISCFSSDWTVISNNFQTDWLQKHFSFCLRLQTEYYFSNNHWLSARLTVKYGKEMHIPIHSSVKFDMTKNKRLELIGWPPTMHADSSDPIDHFLIRKSTRTLLHSNWPPILAIFICVYLLSNGVFMQSTWTIPFQYA